MVHLVCIIARVSGSSLGIKTASSCPTNRFGTLIFCSHQGASPGTVPNVGLGIQTEENFNQLMEL